MTLTAMLTHASKNTSAINVHFCTLCLHPSLQEFDGASRSNPGVAGAGAVIYNVSTKQEVAVVRQRFERATNNQAEAAALLLGMEVRGAGGVVPWCVLQHAVCAQAARGMGFKRVHVFGDSELIVRQVWGCGDCCINIIMSLIPSFIVFFVKYCFLRILWGSHPPPCVHRHGVSTRSTTPY